MKHYKPFILLIFINIISAKEECCDDDPLIGCFTDDYPFDNMPLPHCLDRINPTITLYTRETPDSGETINRDYIPITWHASRRTVFLTHGYIQGGEVAWLEDMKDAMLKHYDYNVIIVGWWGGSLEPWYPQAASNTRTVGSEIGNIINNLIRNGGATANNFWCVGHSLGSHLCGHVGNFKIKIGRITGMDPAGPWFDQKDDSVGLNPRAADFVDAWHTHGDPNIAIGTGTLKPLGHVDFYPNGGQRQPGCIFDPYSPKGDPKSSRTDWTLACSHQRVLDLFIESLDPSCQFYTRHMCWDTYNIPDSCIPCAANNQPCSTMGPDAEKYFTPGAEDMWYYLPTNTEAPFCMG